MLLQAAPADEIRDSESRPPMTLTEAARVLRMSRARLSERLLLQELSLVGPGLVDRDEVEALVDRLDLDRQHRRRRTGERLARVPEMALWLLHDWGGAARLTELASTLETTLQTMHSHLRVLRDHGYLAHTHGQDWTLTAEGWRYVKQHPRPII